MDFGKITTENWLLFATKQYDNPQCHSTEEFNEDLRRFSSIKRLLLRLYRGDKNVCNRMLLNHIITINNLFGTPGGARLLLVYCDKSTSGILLSFLKYLNSCPDNLPEAKDILPDENTILELKEL